MIKNTFGKNGMNAEHFVSFTNVYGGKSSLSLPTHHKFEWEIPFLLLGHSWNVRITLGHLWDVDISFERPEAVLVL